MYLHQAVLSSDSIRFFCKIIERACSAFVEAISVRGIPTARRTENASSNNCLAAGMSRLQIFLESMDENEILKNGARDCAPLRYWGKGAVTLLGDSAHPCRPNLGQGGCMALEDAVILAKCLGSGLPIEAALPRYESLRFHRTKHLQQCSLVMGYIRQWQAPLFVNGRNIVTRMLPARLIERNLRRVYSYAA